MKLRFRPNSLRLRVNRREVSQLASGKILREEIHFPAAQLAYELVPDSSGRSEVQYADGLMRVSAPLAEVTAWAESEIVGLYFEFPGNRTPLKVAIEKDLECVDGPEEEHDPDAFPRKQEDC